MIYIYIWIKPKLNQQFQNSKIFKIRNSLVAISASGVPRTFLYAVPLRGRVESRTPKKQTNPLGDSRFLWRSSTFKFTVKGLSSTLTAANLSSNFLPGG